MFGDTNSNSSSTSSDNYHISHISCGWSHNLVVVEPGGRAFSWGNSLFGALGHGHALELKEKSSMPRCIEMLSCIPGCSVSNVACGVWHSVLVTSNSEVYTFGHNVHGQCGSGEDSEKIRFDPTLLCELLPYDADQNDVGKLSEDEIIIDIKCGSRHTIALTSRYRVFGWGYDEYGQISGFEASNPDSEAAGRSSSNTVHYDVTASVNKCRGIDKGRMVWKPTEIELPEGKEAYRLFANHWMSGFLLRKSTQMNTEEIHL